MNPIEEFYKQCAAEIEEQGDNGELINMAKSWMSHPALNHYCYHFSWLGRPIIQYPQDIIAMQELLWEVKPDLVIETGIAHGGSLIFHASILELNAICGGPKNYKLIGIDIDIRKHNLDLIIRHPIYKLGHIMMLEGSSTSNKISDLVKSISSDYNKIMVILDSNHTYNHVFSELEIYAKLVSKGSYCVVFDTFIEDMPSNAYPDRPWGKNDNPSIAVKEFLKHNHDFYIDSNINKKLLITSAPNGYLKHK